MTLLRRNEGSALLCVRERESGREKNRREEASARARDTGAGAALPMLANMLSKKVNMLSDRQLC